MVTETDDEGTARVDGGSGDCIEASQDGRPKEKAVGAAHPTSATAEGIRMGMAGHQNQMSRVAWLMAADAAALGGSIVAFL